MPTSQATQFPFYIFIMLCYANFTDPANVCETSWYRMRGRFAHSQSAMKGGRTWRRVSGNMWMCNWLLVLDIIMLCWARPPSLSLEAAAAAHVALSFARNRLRTSAWSVAAQLPNSTSPSSRHRLILILKFTTTITGITSHNHTMSLTC
jgi:hypothetical protein